MITRLKILQFVILVLSFSHGERVYILMEEPKSHKELPLPPPVEGFEYLTWIEWHPDYPGKWIWLSTYEETQESMEFACQNLGLEFEEKDIEFYNHLKFYLECYKHHENKALIPKIENATLQLLRRLTPKNTMWSGHFDMNQEDEDLRCNMYQWSDDKQAYEEVPAPSCNDRYYGLCVGEPQHAPHDVSTTTEAPIEEEIEETTTKKAKNKLSKHKNKTKTTKTPTTKVTTTKKGKRMRTRRMRTRKPPRTRPTPMPRGKGNAPISKPGQAGSTKAPSTLKG